METSSSSSSSSRGFSTHVQKLLSHRGVANSPLQFRQALSAADVLVTDEKHVADIIVGVLPNADDTQKFNLEVVVEVLSQDCNITGGKKMNWKKVVENLDNSSLFVRSLDEFQLLAKLFLRISISRYTLSRYNTFCHFIVPCLNRNVEFFDMSGCGFSNRISSINWRK